VNRRSKTRRRGAPEARGFLQIGRRWAEGRAGRTAEAPVRNFLCGVIGLCLALVGWQEYTLMGHSRAEPAVVELAALERGEIPENVHLRIGRHWRAWDELIYRWEIPQHQKEPDQNSTVKFVYYPILSSSHPYLKRVDEALERYGSWEAIPEQEQPKLDDFTVLVRSQRITRVGALPDGQWNESDAVQGLIVNGVRSLGIDERVLLQQSFPTLDLDAVLILEEDRKPASTVACLGMLGGGAMLLLATLYLLLVKRRAAGLPAPPPLIELPGAG
jgi:hypothetical protein